MGLEVFDHYECDGQMEIENIVPVRTLTHLSLFSGIGGLDLAAEWAGFESVGQCEFADYPTKILEQHWPKVPRWRDIRTLTGESFYERTGLQTVDVISGGFPCQPFSNAGKRRGKEDDRYLWPEMVRVIAELRPAWVIGENVAGIINMALDTVLSDLEGQGYTTRTFLIPASGVNAPHQRYRTAIVAHAESNNSGRLPVRKKTKKSRFVSSSENVSNTDCTGFQTSGAKQQETGASGNGEDVPNSNGTGCQKLHLPEITGKKGLTGGRINERKICNTTGQGLPDRPSQPMERYKTQKPESQRPDRHVPRSECEGLERQLWDYTPQHWKNQRVFPGPVRGEPRGERQWATEPRVGRVANGVSHRVDRIKCLGNAVVPQQFYPIFKAIAEIETGIQN